LLLDEPFSNLDAALRLQTRGEVKKLVDQFDLTTVFVTHDQGEAVAMGHRIAVMQRGHIEQVGTYHELYQEPANLFVAGFLGSPPMNFFPARWQQDALVLEVDGPPILLPEPSHLLSRRPPDSHLTVGVRPEHLRLSSTTDPAGLPGTVEMVEVSMSDMTQVLYVRQGQRTLHVKIDLHRPIRPRDTVRLQLPPQSLYYFDRNGKRL